nr:hypothetical protein [Tanacetum cinerariifolium]
MRKSYCSLQQSEVSSVESTTNKFLQTPHHPPFFKQLVYVFDHATNSFLLQCAPSSLWQGKENGVNILKSIDKGPFQMGTLRETLTEGTEECRGHGNNARGAGAAGYWGAQNRVGYANLGQARQIKCYNCNGIGHIARNYTQPKRLQNSKYFKDKMLLMQAQENGDLALNMDNVFQADDYDAFDFDVDEAHTAQIMFMANLSFADPVYDEPGPSYDSDVLSEYVKDNAVQVVQSDVSAVPNDAYMMILNDMHDSPAQHVYVTTQTKAVDKSLTAKLTTYKEQVELKASIGYKSPLYLTRAKQVQPALYNGHEIIKNDHVPAIVHNSKDTLEIAEITRKKMNEKMKTQPWTHHKINKKPPRLLQREFSGDLHSTNTTDPEQIFWSKDVLEMKTKALKEQAKATKPIKALTVYPPDTPVKLVPRVLPTKSQVKINIFALIL